MRELRASCRATKSPRCWQSRNAVEANNLTDCGGMSAFRAPSERITMVVMLNSGADIPGSWRLVQDITRIIGPDNLWPDLPKEEK